MAPDHAPSASTDNVCRRLTQDAQQGAWLPAQGVPFHANAHDDTTATLATRAGRSASPLRRLHPLQVLESGVINVRM